MKSHFKLFGFLAVSFLLLFLVGLAPAMATTPNVSLTTPVVVVPLQLSGQYTADGTAVAKFTMPFPARVLGITMTAQASGGTNPTLAIDVKEGSTSILTAPTAITAGAVANAAIADYQRADEAVVTVNLDLGGTNPTWDNITIFITLARK